MVVEALHVLVKERYSTAVHVVYSVVIDRTWSIDRSSRERERERETHYIVQSTGEHVSSAHLESE